MGVCDAIILVADAEGEGGSGDRIFMPILQLQLASTETAGVKSDEVRRLGSEADIIVTNPSAE